ncbi:hypothetical protein WOLCODRAFT_158872 [Wolfiporia cocos MD-104 SS10]|uniref:Uncharacterized protein n=1 Tax=Wolfiporia cocos (strain MD-104) TaxID=742152 RepID=A0A2H3JCK9_WOLCO|nr:hypothetical protein WOLCODRAFT_158872 [Wolfiporia cocos MD-104 SS10]
MQARGVPAPPRAPSLQSTAHGSAACLTNRALGLDDPQLHPAPRAYPQGRTNTRGIASVPAPVVWATAQALGQGIHPARNGGTIRLNNWDLRRCSGLTTKHPRPSVNPRGNPARALIERGAASAQDIPSAQALGPQGLLDTRVQTRTPPDPSGSDKRPRTSGRPYGKGNRPRRAKAHDRQGNPPRTKSNGSAACLNNRATPSAGRANQRRAAGKPQGSE